MTARHPDYYALLGVAADANPDAIRAAYRTLAKQHHPDLSGDEEALSTERFLEIQEAYDVLHDPMRRARYDFERARRAEMEAERRKQREIISGRSPAPPIVRPPKKPATARSRLYVRASAVILVATGAFTAYQSWEYYTREPPLVTIVRTDDARRPSPLDGVYSGERLAAGTPSSLVELSNEMERLSRQQASRAPAAKSNPDAPADGASTDANIAAAPKVPPRTPADPSPKDGQRRVDCSGEGRSFYVIRQNNAISVSYNGGAPVSPLLNDTTPGVVVLSKVEPTGRISLGFVKGNKNGAIVLISDAVGNVFRTFGVECSAAAF